MTYTSKSAFTLRSIGGSLTEKIAAELALIDTAIDDTGSLADGKIWIGSAAGVKAAKTPGGDISMTREGVVTVAPVLTLNLTGVVPATETTGTAIQIATTGTPMALNTAGQSGIKGFFSSTATSDTTNGIYIRVDSNGAGQEAITGRFKTLAKRNDIGNAHGVHGTLETDTSAGGVTGLGTGIRGNLVVADRAHAAGTYYGMLAEIYPLGNTAAVPAGSNACLGINAQSGTAMDLVANAISFSGTDGTGAMIDASSVTPTYVGSIRILVNGAIRYLYYGSNAT